MRAVRHRYMCRSALLSVPFANPIWPVLLNFEAITGFLFLFGRVLTRLFSACFIYKTQSLLLPAAMAFQAPALARHTGMAEKTWACRPVVSRFLCKFASKLLTAAYHGRLMSVCLRAHCHRPAGCHSSRCRASAGRHRWRGEGRAESRRGGMHVADC